MSLSDVYSDVWHYDALNPARQAQILDELKRAPATDYYLPYVLEYLMSRLDKATAIDLYERLMSSVQQSYASQRILTTLTQYIYNLDPKVVRRVIESAPNNNDLQKHIFIFQDLTIDEEELGLRALSKSRYCPEFVFDSKYKPTLDALKRLPPIMRLNCLEALCSARIATYNVFENIKDGEEFKSLLFSSALKHRDRAEVIWNKYVNISGVGHPSSIKISGCCVKCGEFEITLSNKVIRTAAALRVTRFGRMFDVEHTNCPICYGNVNSASITESEWKK
jgi:hypothetical protein